jgi:hypothetical protein
MSGYPRLEAGGSVDAAMDATPPGQVARSDRPEGTRPVVCRPGRCPPGPMAHGEAFSAELKRLLVSPS